MTGSPRIDGYPWSGGEESLLRFGPDGGPIVVLALPLFEESNRTRSFGVAILRALAGFGIGGMLPDLPGQGESLVPLQTLSLLRMTEAYGNLIDAVVGEGRQPYALGIRSGALLDRCGRVHGRWHLAPQAGPELLRELSRIWQAASGTHMGECQACAPSPSAERDESLVEIAGNRIGTALLHDLAAVAPRAGPDSGRVRVVRLESDPRPADRHVPGAPLWRRSEPGNDPALAALLAEDIASWVRRCAG